MTVDHMANKDSVSIHFPDLLLNPLTCLEICEVPNRGFIYNWDFTSALACVDSYS